jgi:gentisate 1,2-dioxygenase
MLRYPWKKTRACLVEMAECYSEAVLSINYVNPETGASVLPSIGFGALMLRPGERVTLPRRTAPMVFHAVEGSGQLSADGDKPWSWKNSDTLSVPGYSEISLINASADTPAFLITADESPLHNYLRIF